MSSRVLNPGGLVLDHSKATDGHGPSLKGKGQLDQAVEVKPLQETWCGAVSGLEQTVK